MARENHTLSLHERTGRMFEQQGERAYPHGRNPYNAGTMANERWAKGWHAADNAACARPYITAMGTLGALDGEY